MPATGPSDKIHFCLKLVSSPLMSRVDKSVIVPHTAEQMFLLVDDVARYPQFLPWCGGAEVIEQNDERTVATIFIDYMGLKQSFTTENRKHGQRGMDLRLREGPFKRLEGTWRFHALGEDACKVELSLDYSFANALLEAAVGPVFGMIAATMMERFVARAEKIYGDH